MDKVKLASSYKLTIANNIGPIVTVLKAYYITSRTCGLADYANQTH